MTIDSIAAPRARKAGKASSAEAVPDWRPAACQQRDMLVSMLNGAWTAGSHDFRCNDEIMLLDFAEKHLDLCDLYDAELAKEDWRTVLTGLRSAVMGAMALSGSRQTDEWRASLEGVLAYIVESLGDAAHFPEHEPPAETGEGDDTLVAECHDMLTDATAEIELIADEMLAIIGHREFGESHVRHLGRGMMLRVKKLALDVLFDALEPGANNATPATIREAIYG